MPHFEIAILATSMIVLIGIVLRLTWLTLREPARSGEIALNRDGSFAMVCVCCGESAEVPASALAPLSSAEKALVVRERPGVVGQRLVEFPCPACDASHCYSVHRQTMTYVGVNLYQGQHSQANCKECQRSILTPPWRKGAFDGNVGAAPGDTSALGLSCKFCGAICCVPCCQDATRNRTADGTLLCPRCFRGPNDQFCHQVPGTAMEPRRNHAH
jgi:hypothetical protein